MNFLEKEKQQQARLGETGLFMIQADKDIYESIDLIKAAAQDRGARKPPRDLLEAVNKVRKPFIQKWFSTIISITGQAACFNLLLPTTSGVQTFALVMLTITAIIATFLMKIQNMAIDHKSLDVLIVREVLADVTSFSKKHLDPSCYSDN